MAKEMVIHHGNLDWWIDDNGMTSCVQPGGKKKVVDRQCPTWVRRTLGICLPSQF